MRLGFKGRPDALLFEITNAGHDQTSVCWDHHDYSLKILERRITGDAAERWFAYVCQLDPCAAHVAKGFTQPQDGCQACDHWTDPAVWLKVQPSLGVTISVPQMQSLVDEAIDRPSMQNRIKRLNFCMWTQAHTIWIPSDRWDACAVPAPDRPPLSGKNSGFACAAGFDMSEKLDLTACDIAQRLDDVDDSKAHTVEIEDVDTTGQKTKKAFKINFSIELYSFFWLPEDTLRERVKNEKIPFDQWAADGFLRVTPGPVIDYDEIYDQFMGEIVPTFSPQRTGYDPHNATQFAVQLRDRGKQEIAEVKQGRALSETAKLLEALILLRRVRHNGNPVMGWCVSNANPKRDRYENLWLEKPSATKRIDGVIAGLIALNQLMLLPPVRRRRAKPRKWTPQGFVDAVPDETPGATP
jgi:phage terminase large subunit-like protein